MTPPIVAVDTVSGRIHLVRGQRVMLDADLAELYGVATKVFNQAIKRNIERFPADFMFQLTAEEHDSLRSQIVTSYAIDPLGSQTVTLKTGRGGRRYLPYVFTEHGAIMAASVLNSPQAVEMSVFVVRAFVRLREVLLTHSDLTKKLSELERKVGGHDSDIRAIISAIKQLMSPPPTPTKKRIGFQKG